MSYIPGPIDDTLSETELRSAPLTVTFNKVIKSVPINVSALGDTTIVAAVTGKRIKIIGFSIQALGTVTVKFKDGAVTDLTGPYSFQTREGVSVFADLPGNALGTTAGNALILNLSAAVSVVGFVTYFDDDAS